MEKKIESTDEGNDKETLVTLMAKSYIAEDCPGLLFDWNYTAVSLFVEKANSSDMNYLQDDEDTVRPPWFKSWPLTSESFMWFHDGLGRFFERGWWGPIIWIMFDFTPDSSSAGVCCDNAGKH